MLSFQGFVTPLRAQRGTLGASPALESTVQALFERNGLKIVAVRFVDGNIATARCELVSISTLIARLTVSEEIGISMPRTRGRFPFVAL